MTGTPADPSLSGTAPILFDALDYSLLNAPLVVLVFAVLLYTSGSVVQWSLEYAGVELSRSNSDSNSDANSVSDADSNPGKAAETDGAGETDDADGVDDADDVDGAAETNDVDDVGDMVETDGVDNVNEPTAEDTGAVIGKAENVLVLSLMLLQAYTALGVIFAAKSIVRKSDMGREDTSYYLTGTMANFTYSVVVGLVLHLSLWAVVRFDLYGGLSPILG